MEQFSRFCALFPVFLRFPSQPRQPQGIAWLVTKGGTWKPGYQLSPAFPSHRGLDAQGAQGAPATGAFEDHERAGNAEKNPGDQHFRRTEERARDDQGDAA